MMTYLELTTKLAAIDDKYSKFSDKGQQEKTKLIVIYNKERKKEIGQIMVLRMNYSRRIDYYGYS